MSKTAMVHVSQIQKGNLIAYQGLVYEVIADPKFMKDAEQYVVPVLTKDPRENPFLTFGSNSVITRLSIKRNPK